MKLDVLSELKGLLAVAPVVRAPAYFSLGEALEQALVTPSSSDEEAVMAGYVDAPNLDPLGHPFPHCPTSSTIDGGLLASPWAPSGPLESSKGDEAASQPSMPTHNSHPMANSSASTCKPIIDQADFDPLILRVGPSSTVTGSASTQRRAALRKALKTDMGHVPTPAAKKQFAAASTTVSAQFDAAELPAAAGAYIAKDQRSSPPKFTKNPGKAYTLDELVHEHGFELLEWDGIHPFHIFDKEDRVLVSCVGRPNSPRYMEHAQQAHQLFMHEREAANIPVQVEPHLRGTYPAIHVGGFHGKGTSQPVFLNCKGNEEMTHCLVNSSHVQALASFASYAFSLCQPQVYRHCWKQLQDFYEKQAAVARLFPAHVSIYPAATFNLGPRVCCYKHRDSLNLAYGMCSVQALGDFDPKKGGHLVLWDLHMVVEFPPGSLILLPSALITHSNLPVQPDESRSSFTQYISGGIMRWVEYDFQTEKHLKSKNPTKFKEMEANKPKKWREGLELWSKAADLLGVEK